MYITLTLSTLDSYVVELSTTMLRSEYRDQIESVSAFAILFRYVYFNIFCQLCYESIRLLANPSRRRPLDRKIFPALRQVQGRANILFTIDTHAAAETGGLVFGGRLGSYQS